MRIPSLVAAAALTLSLPSLALACENAHAAEAKKASFGMVTVPQLASFQKAGKVTVLDANMTDTREKYGVIPGATLLTSMSKYDIAKELPTAKDQKLVFYCANTQCGASHTAAERAMGAGYTDVSVLPDGIQGWVKAGQKVDKTPRS